MKRLTKKKINKILATYGIENANILRVDTKEVEIHYPDDDEKNYNIAEKIMENLGWEGYVSGYGSWVLKPIAHIGGTNVR